MESDLIAQLQGRFAQNTADQLPNEAANAIARLRAERDEARREVCVLMQRTGFLRGDYADERGWDCFCCAYCGTDDTGMCTQDQQMCVDCQRGEHDGS